MSERVPSEVAEQLLAIHRIHQNSSEATNPCECFRCRSLRDLLDVREDQDKTTTLLGEEIIKTARAGARVKVLEEALQNLMTWGVEFDDARVRYISVQVDRPAVEAAERALRGEVEK